LKAQERSTQGFEEIPEATYPLFGGGEEDLNDSLSDTENWMEQLASGESPLQKRVDAKDDVASQVSTSVEQAQLE